MNCKKCNSPMTIVLRNKDYYCDECFMINTNHKFRACIGKNKVLSRNENVLIGLSGGVGSTVLLDLVHHGISLENTKKLRIFPCFLHLFDDSTKIVAESVLKQCQKYNSDVYIVHLSMYMNVNIQLPKANTIPNLKEKEIEEFQDMLNSMPSSVANDFLVKVKRDLLVRFAKLLNCNAIFTAETTNTLAINLLSNLALGRGSQVQNDVGFADIRDDKVKIFRPIKDISKEELNYYVNIKKLAPVFYENLKNNSLQSVISSFVSDLQENFQATISTVCKTADKIGDYHEGQTNKQCVICKSDLHTKDMKLSALEATNISRTVSFGNMQIRQDEENSADVNNLSSHVNVSMFPLIHKQLCYGCSRNYSEMKQPKLPLHIQTALARV